MKLKRHMLNESKMTVKEMLNFLIQNQQYVPDYKLADIWESVARDKFKKDTGFYPTTSRYTWQISDLGWELKDTNNMNYEEILKDFKQFQGKSSDSPQEQMEKTQFTDLLRYAKWDGKNFTGISDYNLNTLVRFLRYIVYGKLDNNLAQANDIIDKLRPTEGFVRAVNDFRNVKMPEVGNITMSRLKNGKIIIKGLNKRQIDHIHKIIGMVGRF